MTTTISTYRTIYEVNIFAFCHTFRESLEIKHFLNIYKERPNCFNLNTHNYHFDIMYVYHFEKMLFLGLVFGCFISHTNGSKGIIFYFSFL